jgi:hypothetical protein
VGRDELMLGILKNRSDPSHESAGPQTRRLVAERAYDSAPGAEQPRKDHRQRRLPASVRPGDR